MAQASERLADRVVVRLPREDRIRDILAAAKDVFCRRGFADASMGEIASLAGVAQGTIYKFFDSKRDLVIAVLHDWFESMVAGFQADLPVIRGTQNKLRFIIRRHIQSLVENPDLCRLCANEVRNDGDNYQSAIYELTRNYSQALIEVCREGIRSGELRADLPISIVRDLIFGGIDHHLSGFLYRGRKLDPDGLADKLMDILNFGVAAERQQVSPLEATTARLELVAERLERTMLDRNRAKKSQRRTSTR